MGRKDLLRARIAMAERELARLESLPDFDGMPEGTVLLVMLGGRRRPVPCVGIKRGGLWTFTDAADFRASRVGGDRLAELLTGPGITVTDVVNLAVVETVDPVVDLGAMLLDSIQEYVRPPRGGIRYPNVCQVPDCGCVGMAHP
jgi:hypothetical protein